MATSPAGSGDDRGPARRPTPRATSDPTGSEQPRRGRPRSEKARTAILDAAAELLLAQPLKAVSMDAVAERAGVSKATIYRWWPTKETLALDALYQQWDTAPASPRDTGSLRDDLLALLIPWVRRLRTRPYGRVIAALITQAQTDPDFATEYRARFVQPRRDPARALLQRAIERGDIPAHTSIDVALDILYGPLYHRLLHGHGPLDDSFVQAVVDTALGGLAPTPAKTPSRHRPPARPHPPSQPAGARSKEDTT